jgi:hypothetical protein
MFLRNVAILGEQEGRGYVEKSEFYHWDIFKDHINY